MDDNYINFIQRMGSFSGSLDIEIEDPLKHSVVTRNRSAVSKDQLTHFGIKGMKWGSRKGSGLRVNSGIASKAAKAGQDATSLGQTINKVGFNNKTLREAKQLSDEELKRLTNRLTLENSYINSKNQQAGRSKVENLLATVGSTLALASSAAILYDSLKKVK